MRRREGPHRFMQKRPPTFVSALQRVSAVETSKNQLSRDFRCCSIFDFCNSIGTFRTSSSGRMSASRQERPFHNRPFREFVGYSLCPTDKLFLLFLSVSELTHLCNFLISRPTDSILCHSLINLNRGTAQSSTRTATRAFFQRSTVRILT